MMGPREKKGENRNGQKPGRTCQCKQCTEKGEPVKDSEEGWEEQHGIMEITGGKKHTAERIA